MSVILLMSKFPRAVGSYMSLRLFLVAACLLLAACCSCCFLLWRRPSLTRPMTTTSGPRVVVEGVACSSPRPRSSPARRASSVIYAKTTAAASAAAGIIEKHTGIDLDGDGKVKGKDENAVACESDKINFSFSEVAIAHALATAPFGPGSKCAQRIPWYIIDPTGRVIAEQRQADMVRNKRTTQRRGLASLKARFLVRCPTLYPMWDAITAFALIFTALVTPFEVGFLPPPESTSNGLWMFNRFIEHVPRQASNHERSLCHCNQAPLNPYSILTPSTLVRNSCSSCFVVDVLLAFFTMRPISFEKAAATLRSNNNKQLMQWETSLWVIARQYLATWFLIDVASIAPSAFDFLPSAFASDGSSASGNSYRVFRTIRALRLIKLVRLAKTSRLVERLNEYVSLDGTTQTCMSLSVRALLLTHWMACTLMVSTTFAEDPMQTWLATHGYCYDNGVEKGCVEVSFMYLKVQGVGHKIDRHASLQAPTPARVHRSLTPWSTFASAFTAGFQVEPCFCLP